MSTELPIDDVVDDLVEAWHENHILHFGPDLGTFLGMTPGEYSAWAVAPSSLDEHLHGYLQWLHSVAVPAPTEPPQWREPEGGPDAGHTWRIEVTSRSSSSVVGDPEHTDAADFSGYPMRASVRAWSLKAAFRAAAELPLTEWLPMEDEGGAP